MSHGSLKRRVAFALGLVVLAVVAWLWIQRGQDRRSLATYKTLLIAQGEKLSIDQTISPPATADDPDYHQFQAAVRRLQGETIQPGGSEFTEFVAPGELKPLDLRTNFGFSRGAVVTWAVWETEVQAMQQHLDELRRALRSPAPRSDVDYRTPGARGPGFMPTRGRPMAGGRSDGRSARHEPHGGG